MQRESKEVESFYKSKAWKQARELCILSHNGLCERCLAQGKTVAGNYVHHKTYITTDNINDASITLNQDNLELLCFDCHQQEHFGKADDFYFDEDGNFFPRGCTPHVE